MPYEDGHKLTKHVVVKIRQIIKMNCCVYEITLIVVSHCTTGCLQLRWNKNSPFITPLYQIIQAYPVTSLWPSVCPFYRNNS